MSGSERAQLSNQWMTPFLRVGAVWLFIGLVFSYWLHKDTAQQVPSLRWVAILGSVVLADLIALGGVISAVCEWTAGVSKNQASLILRTSSWGVIKLACLGTLGWLLYFGRNIPGVALFFGLGTMTIVPIIGGLRWH